jgi:glutaredoxin
MKRSTLLLALLSAGTVLAQSTYRWVDQDGKVHYGDRPPPPKAAKEVKERKVALPEAEKPQPYDTRKAQESFPVTLYVTPDCAAPCKAGRDYLARRGIPFTEKSLESAEEIVALREQLGGGDIGVPILMVGNKNAKGFLESSWGGLLDAAGYPKAR